MYTSYLYEVAHDVIYQVPRVNHNQPLSELCYLQGKVAYIQPSKPTPEPFSDVEGMEFCCILIIRWTSISFLIDTNIRAFNL